MVIVLDEMTEHIGRRSLSRKLPKLHMEFTRSRVPVIAIKDKLRYQLQQVGFTFNGDTSPKIETLLRSCILSAKLAWERGECGLYTPVNVQLSRPNYEFMPDDFGKDCDTYRRKRHVTYLFDDEMTSLGLKEHFLRDLGVRAEDEVRIEVIPYGEHFLFNVWGIMVAPDGIQSNLFSMVRHDITSPKAVFDHVVRAWGVGLDMLPLNAVHFLYRQDHPIFVPLMRVPMGVRDIQLLFFGNRLEQVFRGTQSDKEMQTRYMDVLRRRAEKEKTPKRRKR